MRRIRCNLDLLHLLNTSDSESDSESVDCNSNTSDTSLKTITMAPSDPPADTTTRVEKTELASVISLNTQNNYGKVVGLKHFEGGKLINPDHPTLVCVTSAREWVHDIDSRTSDNWTDKGRIQLAKQYALGAAYKAIKVAVDRYGYDWEKVKEKLIKTFRDGETYYERKNALSAARREPGESTSAFWIRLEEMVGELRKERPEHIRTYEIDQVTAFLSAFPKTFQTTFTEAERDQPDVVFEKSHSFIERNPQYKLSDKDIAKETKRVVAVVADASPVRDGASVRPKTNQASREKTQSSRVECHRCHKRGHVARVCRADLCKNCGTSSHTTAACRRQSNRRPREEKKTSNSW